MRIDGTGERTMLRPGRWQLRATRHKYEAWINNNPLGLTEQDERIYIVNIRESSKEENATMEKSRYDGTWPILQYRSSLEVTLVLQIKAEQPETRMQVLRKIIAWCEDGRLRVSTRPNQFLVGAFTKMPLGKMQAWTSKLELTFTAYGLPYWQEDVIRPLVLRGANESGEMRVAGNTAYAYMTAHIQNDSTVTIPTILITTFQDNVQLSAIYLFGLQLTPGESIDINYDMRHRLQITQEGIDIASQRGAMSSDDFIVKPGINQILFDTYGYVCTCTFEGRGLYL